MRRPRFATLLILLASVPHFTRAAQPTTAKEWFQKGRELYDADREADAVACFNQALRLDPGDADSLCWRGRSYANLDRPERAARDFAAALKINPKHAETHLGLAWLRIGQKDFKQAITEASTSIELEPQNARYRYSRANMRHRFIPDATISDIRKDYDQAIKLDDKYTLAYIARGGLKWESGDLQGAVADQTKAIELDNRNPVSFGNRAMAYHALGKSDLAQADFKQAFELDPRCRDYFEQQLESYKAWQARKEELRKSGEAPKDGNALDRICPYCHSWTYNRSGACTNCGKYSRGTD